MAKFTPTPQYSDRLISALGWAAQLHQFQMRKYDETPYVAHLLSVCALVLEHKGTEDDAIAALLHDAVEDINVTMPQIEQRFGLKVAEIVSVLSEDKSNVNWLARKLNYIDKIVAEDSYSVALVATCDKLHNMRSYWKCGTWSLRLQSFHQAFYDRIVVRFCPEFYDDFREELARLETLIGDA